MAASAPITAIMAVGRAMQASGSKPGPAIAYSPAPYALRTMTEIFGTVASDTALIILAPWRMIPSRSTAVPTMKPGTSARKSSGTLNASHNWMKRVALSAESTNNTPPLNIGLLATTPTTLPSSRPNPTSSSRAHSAWISKNEPSSSSALTYLRMSKACRSLTGTSARRSPLPASTGSVTGGSSEKFDGRYDKYWRTVSSASGSSLARKCPTPETEQCIFAPPISSSVVFSPTTISTMRAEPRYIDALPSTMTTTSQNAGMYAPPAALGPNSAQTCGMLPEARTWV